MPLRDLRTSVHVWAGCQRFCRGLTLACICMLAHLQRVFARCTAHLWISNAQCGHSDMEAEGCGGQGSDYRASAPMQAACMQATSLIRPLCCNQAMCRFSHPATFSHCSKSVRGLSRACVSSGNTQMRASGAASPRAFSARTYCCASTSGTLHAGQLQCLSRNAVSLPVTVRGSIQSPADTAPVRPAACRRVHREAAGDDQGPTNAPAVLRAQHE